MKYARMVVMAALLLSCMPERTRECLGSNECDEGRVCRAGVCVRVNAGPQAEPDAGEAVVDSQTSDPVEDAVADAAADAGSDDATIDVGDASDATPSPCPDAREPARGDLRINEILANPPPDALGDANRDGVRDAFEDEFVEVVNVADEQLDLTRTRLFVGGSARVLFSDLCLPPGEGVVVFGGYRGRGLPVVARGSIARVASSRLGLSNSGGTVSLSLGDGTALDSVTYADAPPESLTRAPQLLGSDFAVHSALPGARLMSPGQCADGSLLTTRCPNSEPQPDAGQQQPDVGE